MSKQTYPEVTHRRSVSKDQTAKELKNTYTFDVTLVIDDPEKAHEAAFKAAWIAEQNGNLRKLTDEQLEELQEKGEHRIFLSSYFNGKEATPTTPEGRLNDARKRMNRLTEAEKQIIFDELRLKKA